MTIRQDALAWPQGFPRFLFLACYFTRNEFTVRAMRSSVTAGAGWLLSRTRAAN